MGIIERIKKMVKPKGKKEEKKSEPKVLISNGICPECDGGKTTGKNGEFCANCNGSGIV